MNRLNWRDVVVDVFAIVVMVGMVLLGAWTMQACAPWVVAVVAGRWGAGALNRYQASREVRSDKKPSDPPPPSLGKPAPDSGIVLALALVGGLLAAALKAHYHRGA